MTDTIRSTPRVSGSVAFAWRGQFGERVCTLLAAEFPSCQESRADASAVSAAITSGARVVVLALWRPYPELCEQVDQLAFQQGAAWLPVIMESAAIRIGPLVRPAAGPCFRCYWRRRSQHDRQQWSSAAVQAAYDQDPGCGPEGFLPHHARLAAGIAGSVVAGLVGGAYQRKGSPEPGQVATIRLPTVDVRLSRVVSCHGCDRCAGPGKSTDSSWLPQLAAELQERRMPADAESRETVSSCAGRRLGAR